MPFGYDSTFDLADLGSLTAVGASAAQKCTGASLAFQVSAASVGTSVTIRFEGSLDGDAYFNLNSSGEDFSLTQDGTTGYFLVAPVQYVRFRMVSSVGGSPTVSCKLGTM